MSMKRVRQQTSLKTALDAAFSSLGNSDVIFVQFALDVIAPDWSADLGGIFADEATLVLVPCGGDDEIGPSFLISRETYGFRLDQVHWDVMLEVGVFPSLIDVVGALKARLASCAALTAPASAMLH
jgi:hypothetical protein